MMTSHFLKLFSLCSIVLANALILTPFVSARFDDKSPRPSGDKTSDKKPGEQPSDAKPNEKSLLDRLGDELLKEVDENPNGKAKSKDEESDKLDRAVKGMRSAGDKLDGGQTAKETQKIQVQVIKDLEDIINQLENPPPNQGGGGGGGGGGDGGGGGGGRSGRGGAGGSSSRLRRPQGSGRQGMSAGKKPESGRNEKDQEDQAGEKDQGKDSSKQLQDARKDKEQTDRNAKEEAARRQKLEMDVWGHLPPHLREELLNTYGERMLPKYEHLVKQFYEALSTQGDSKKK